MQQEQIIMLFVLEHKINKFIFVTATFEPFEILLRLSFGDGAMDIAD